MGESIWNNQWIFSWKFFTLHWRVFTEFYSPNSDKFEAWKYLEISAARRIELLAWLVYRWSIASKFANQKLWYESFWESWRIRRHWYDLKKEALFGNSICYSSMVRAMQRTQTAPCQSRKRALNFRKTSSQVITSRLPLWSIATICNSLMALSLFSTRKFLVLFRFLFSVLVHAFSNVFVPFPVTFSMLPFKATLLNRSNVSIWSVWRFFNLKKVPSRNLKV